jgi:hypothetical protein
VVGWGRSSPRAGPGLGIPPSPPDEAGTIFIPIMAIPVAQMLGEREYLPLLRVGHAGWGQVGIGSKVSKVKPCYQALGHDRAGDAAGPGTPVHRRGVIEWAWSSATTQG